METQLMTVEQKFARILMDLRELRPFYSAIYETIPHIENNNIETIGVTTNKLYYNYKFVDEREYAELLFIILHEVAHIALMHPYRGIGLNHKIYNIACDLYVNKILAEEFSLKPGLYSSKFERLKMPEDALYDVYINTMTDSTEAIYYRLLNNGEDDDSNCAYELDLSDLLESDDDEAKQEQDSRDCIASAITRLEMAYATQDFSGIIEQQSIKLIKSYVDWKKLLSKYCIKCNEIEQSFSLPDRRMFYTNLIYPGPAKNNMDKLGDIRICIDVSGSISLDDIGEILYNVKTILSKYKARADILFWNTDIVGRTVIDYKTNISNINIPMGGGTNPSCLFRIDKIGNKHYKNGLTIVFTDGVFSINVDNTIKNKYKNTIWAITSNGISKFVAPFGKSAIIKR